MNVGVVIPVGPGRLENLLLVLDSLHQQTVKPRMVVVVCDGPESWIDTEIEFKLPTAVLRADKHEPGKEQPRNLGVRLLEDLGERDERFAGMTHAWFVDSDVVLRRRALEFYEEAMKTDPTNRILIGPYEWLPPGVREPIEDLHNDPRTASFEDHGPEKIFQHELGSALACFSGNIIWPLDEFARVGGFWNELHHGRCEDGEIGLRASSMGVPSSLVREARGWHLYHDINIGWTQNANAIDVPKLNARHPWVQDEGLIVVDEDGKRFNARCAKCGEEINSGLIWGHQRECQAE